LLCNRFINYKAKNVNGNVNQLGTSEDLVAFFSTKAEELVAA